MIWAYLAASGAMFFALVSAILWQSLRGSQEKITGLLRLNASLSQQLNTQTTCLSTVGKEITRLEQMVDDSRDGAILPILRTILQNGLTASLSHEGSTFQIKLDLKAHFYDEIDLTNVALPPCPQIFIHRDTQKLVDKWAESIKPQVSNEIYRQLCQSLDLVPVEPAFFPTVTVDTKKESTRVA